MKSWAKETLRVLLYVKAWTSEEVITMEILDETVEKK